MSDITHPCDAGARNPPQPRESTETKVWEIEGRAAILDVPTAVIFLVIFAVLARTRLNSAWLIFAAGIVGLLVLRS